MRVGKQSSASELTLLTGLGSYLVYRSVSNGLYHHNACLGSEKSLGELTHIGLAAIREES
jgi:hypothetical protein